MLASRKLFRWEVFKGGSEILKTYADLSRLHFLKMCFSKSEMMISTLPESTIFNDIKVFATLTPWTQRNFSCCVQDKRRSHQEHMVRLSFLENAAGVSYHCDKTVWTMQRRNTQPTEQKKKRKQRAHMSARAPAAFPSLKVSVLGEHLVSTGGVDVHLLLCLNIMNILLFN